MVGSLRATLTRILSQFSPAFEPTKPYTLDPGYSLDDLYSGHDRFARTIPYASTSTVHANFIPDIGHFPCPGLSDSRVLSPSPVTALRLSPLEISDDGLHQYDGNGLRHRDSIDKKLLPSNGDELLSHAERYVAELYHLEGRGESWDALCEECLVVLHDGLGLRCDDCHDLGLYCVPCCIQAHRQHPLHRIQRWNGKEFKVVSFRTLGMRFQLGHSTGRKCQNPIPSLDDSFVVMDLTGIHDVAVDFCGCSEAVSDDTQVLRQRWLPASALRPRTAATFRLLQHIHLLGDQSPALISKYYESLVRLTDNTGVSVPPNRFQSFNIMVQAWQYLKMLKRSGIGYNPMAASIPLGNPSVECPACIQSARSTGDSRVPPQQSWFQRFSQAISSNVYELKGSTVEIYLDLQHSSSDGSTLFDECVGDASVAALTCPHGFKRQRAIDGRGSNCAGVHYSEHGSDCRRPAHREDAVPEQGEELAMPDCGFEDENWGLVTAMPTTLLHRAHLIVPQYEQDLQVFRALTQCVPPAQVKRWYERVMEWEAKPKGGLAPWKIKRSHLSEDSVRADLQMEDAIAAYHRSSAPSKYTVSDIIITGIDLEEEQQRLRHDLAALQTCSTPLRRMQLRKQQISLQRSIDVWHEAEETVLQAVVLERAHNAHAVCSIPSHLQPLYLPSAICSRWPVCDTFLEHEWRLREARAYDALDDLRGHLEIFAYVHAENVGADVEAVERVIRAEIRLDADRYRSSYQALMNLAPALGKIAWKGYFHELLDDDLRYITDYDPARPGDMPWFWCAGGTSFLKPEHLQDLGRNHNLCEALRSAWCKARSRALKSTERYNLLRDEMHRVISFHHRNEQWWGARVGRALYDRADYAEGANAYACRQASLWRSLKNHCYFVWGVEVEGQSCATGSVFPGLDDLTESLVSPSLRVAEKDSVSTG